MDVKINKGYTLHAIRYTLIILAFFTFSPFFTFFPLQTAYAAMGDYCVVPPYVKRDVSVNIMVMLDNSTDMLGPAFTDTTYCPCAVAGDTNCRNVGDTYTNCWDGTKYYKEYLGHFPPTACYVPTPKFKYAGHNVNYDPITGYPYTGCPTGEFNGNVLNWATMSKLTIAKKVLTGEASNSAAKPFAIEGRKTPFWDTVFPIGYRDSDGCRWTVTSTASDVIQLMVEEKPTIGKCKYPFTGVKWDVEIDPTTGIEVRRGVLQDFTDVNPQYNAFDKGAPRFGLTKFVSGAPNVKIDVPIPPTGTYNSFINAFNSSLGTNAFNDLASAHYTDDVYFSAPPNASQDPYTGCASWESPPCVQGTAVPCRKSAILMLTTGTDVSGTKLVSPPLPNALPSECSATETRPLVWNACYAYNTDLRTAADLPSKQNISTYVIQTFGTGTTDCSSPTISGATGCVIGNESPECKIKTLCNTAAQGGGNYYSAGSDNLADTIRKALQDIIKRAAAGTAASVLASGEGSGANLIQAVFYPRAMTIPKGGIFGSEIDWIGRMANYWYYVDPFFAASSIYEDNASVNTLDLTDDNKIQLYFDTSSERTKARRWYDNSATKDGVPETAISPDIEFEKLSSVWEAGVKLWERTSARTIKTTIGGSLIDFSTANASTLRSYLDPGDINGDAVVTDADATMLIEYIHGTDFANLRSRITAIDLNNDGDTLDTVNGVSESAKVWKLGDVLNSTPKVSSWIPLNSYHQKYSDTTYGSGTTGGYINTTNYKNRGMVFAGANDGMLHAFKLGKFELEWAGQGTYQKARLLRTCLLNPATSCSADADCSAAGDRCPQLGEEMWSFIPKNVLPYLKYLTDTGYCHVYSIDLTPYVLDASITIDITDAGQPAGSCQTDPNYSNYWECKKTVNSWRTILIGGMRYGGACKAKNATCATDSVCAPAEVSGASVGYSSYFALDITNQNNPTLLWEFSSDQLGFTTTGPAFVRISARVNPADLTSLPDSTKNGRWFVVFGSGPTGPISTTDQQFMGRSDQNLRLFVLDLKTGSPVRTIDTGIANAFAGSMLNATVDPNPNSYQQDDVVYIPYVKRTGESPNFTWTDGGVGRLVTSEYIDPADVTKWKWSTVIDNIGPVTSSVANLINKSRGELWLYFGSGRYYFEQGVNTDDAAGQRQIFGIKEPCYSGGTLDSNCATPRVIGDLTNVTDIANVPSDPTAAGYNGWYINLDPANSPTTTFTDCDGNSVTCPANQYGYCEGNPATFVCRDYRAERIITDPLTTTTGLAFFTAYKPYKDECTFGGKSAIWATKYDTGGAPGALLKGMALVQVSTGAIEQVDLSKVFTQAGGRKSTALEGVPPTAQGLSIQSTPNPVKRILHIRQR